MYTYEEVSLYNPGITKTAIPSYIFNKVKKEVEQEINYSNNKNNGNSIIQKDYNYFIKPDLKSVIEEVSLSYQNHFGFINGAEIKVSETCKISTQRKYEFVAPKTNDGSLTWYLWIQIPYDLKEELDLSNLVETGSNSISKFQFIYNTLDCGTNVCDIDLDKSWEGVLLLFPSFLRHSMQPFYTSDDYRVFLTGNVWFSRDGKWVYDSNKDWLLSM
jgi:hypothetical protein